MLLLQRHFFLIANRALISRRLLVPLSLTELKTTHSWFGDICIKDLPRSLDYISGLPRYVFKSHFQTTFDDKSGYDHVKLSPDSFTMVGLEWKGWYFCYKNLPFGWKASACIYHSVGLAATFHIRSLSVPCSQYVGDRHFGQLALRRDLQDSLRRSNFQLAEAAAFTMFSVLVRLGYFIGLSKSIPVPKTRFLGFLSDSILQAFLILQDKRVKFATLRDSILQCRPVSISTIRSQGYLFLFNSPGCSVIRERSLPRYFSDKSKLSAHLKLLVTFVQR